VSSCSFGTLSGKVREGSSARLPRVSVYRKSGKGSMMDTAKDTLGFYMFFD